MIPTTATDDYFVINEPEWRHALQVELDQPYMQQLWDELQRRLDRGDRIYPPQVQWFRALELTPLSAVRVLIIGQDPYHGDGQAQGLSFSVAPDQKKPPSLRNIFKELHRDLAIPIADHGCLDAWAHQGVLLLNTVLSVEEAAPGSHQGLGWELFTRKVIELIAMQTQACVIMAWGRHAHKLCDSLDLHRHKLIKTSHPSPLGATKSGKDFAAFLGSSCFSQANAYLNAQGFDAIDWLT